MSRHDDDDLSPVDDPGPQPCRECGGDGGWDDVVGHDPHGPVWRWFKCQACDGTGYDGPGFTLTTKRSEMTLPVPRGYRCIGEIWPEDDANDPPF